MIVSDIKDILSQLIEDEQFPQIPVEIMDNELAKVYANSIKGEVSNVTYIAINFLYVKMHQYFGVNFCTDYVFVITETLGK